MKLPDLKQKLWMPGDVVFLQKHDSATTPVVVKECNDMIVKNKRILQAAVYRAEVVSTGVVRKVYFEYTQADAEPTVEEDDGYPDVTYRLKLVQLLHAENVGAEFMAWHDLGGIGDVVYANDRYTSGTICATFAEAMAVVDGARAELPTELID